MITTSGRLTAVYSICIRLRAEQTIHYQKLHKRHFVSSANTLQRLFNSGLRKDHRKMANRCPQSFDYFLVLDFEATCDEHHKISPQEIIEFPVLKVNAQTFEVESQFQQFVRPVHNPKLTDFCIKLTTITQDDVNGAKTFPQVMEEFDRWIREDVGLDKRFLFVTCGDWDLKVMLPGQCQRENIQLPQYCRKWLNIKKPYSSMTNQYIKGMMPMIQGLKLEHVGQHHRGIDDCRNIANILRELADRGCRFLPTYHLE